MITNNLFACKATENSLHIFTARGSEIVTLYPDAVVTTTVRLRPVELRWLAYAGEQFDKLLTVALAAGPHKQHSLAILPEEEVA